MEKFFDIVCRVGGLTPSAVVLVATVKALKHHGGDPDGGREAIEGGSANMIRHLANIRGFGLNAVVAVNRFPADTDEEIERSARSRWRTAPSRPRGARRFEGAARALRRWPRPWSPRPTQPPISRPSIRSTDDRGEDRGDRDAGLRRATAILLQPAARKKIVELERVGFDGLPICMAKTHLSLSHDPTLANAPTGFTVTVRDIRAYTGAGWLVALCGDMQTMPGYGATPAAHASTSTRTAPRSACFAGEMRSRR